MVPYWLADLCQSKTTQRHTDYYNRAQINFLIIRNFPGPAKFGFQVQFIQAFTFKKIHLKKICFLHQSFPILVMKTTCIWLSELFRIHFIDAVGGPSVHQRERRGGWGRKINITDQARSLVETMKVDVSDYKQFSCTSVSLL